MKKVYIVQIAFSFDNSLVYLPYAAGCLAAAAYKTPEVACEYERPVIIFKRDTVDNVLKDIIDPFVVSFTNYFWNFEYNKLLAKKIKEKYPNCIIAFGGHNISADSSLLESEPYIDLLIHGEGEISFPKFLAAASKGGDYSSVPGADYRKDGKLVSSAPCSYAADISDFPSPYLEGFFDDIVANNPQMKFNATIETNRGCPYSCAYCEWSIDKRLRLFPIEKVKAEIKWVSDKKIEYCYCADGNFGIAGKRDVDIARWVIEVRKLNGYPNIFKPCYAKESNDFVFEAGRILNEAGADKGITISYQTLCPEALKNIKRENLDVSVFTELSSRYNAIGIPTYSDLILGLPGETFRSFCESICGLMEVGQHNSVTFHHCQVYPNALMGKKEYREKYKIETTRVPMDTVHFTPEFSGVDEYFDIITSTYSMPRPDWEKTNAYGVIVEAFHYIGLTRCIALFLRYEMNVPYIVFYDKLFEFISSSSNTFLGGLYKHLKNAIAHPERSWAYQKDIFGSTGWYLEEGLFLECAYNDNVFWNEMLPFAAEFNIDGDIFPQLIHYQREIIRKPEKNSFDIELKYDFYKYFQDIYRGNYSPLQKKNHILHIDTEKEITDWEQYAREIIWYGKRRSATLATNDREKITYIFTQQQ